MVLSVFKYTFDTNKGNNYRLDIIPYKENQRITQKYGDKIYLSISFSLSKYDLYSDNINQPGYETLTNNNEKFELLMRIIYILKEFIEKYDKNQFIYVIGKTDMDTKNRLYQLLSKKLFTDYTIAEDYSNVFDTTKAYYIYK